MRVAKYAFGATLAGAALLAANSATAVVLAQDLGGTQMSSPGLTWSESFVTPSGSSFQDITVNFYAAGGRTVAAGVGYLFAARSTAIGGAGALAASVSSVDGVWSFGPNLRLAPGTRYYFSEDTALPSLMGDASSTLTGGPVANADANFTVSGLAVPVPEPEAWSLMLAGFALAGLGLRRRRVAAA